MTKNEQLILFQKNEDRFFEEGYEKARSELRQQAALLDSIGKKLQEERSQFLQKVKPEIISFCLEVAEQLVRQQLQEPEIMANKIHSLLSALSIGQESISVLLAPEDLEMMEQESQRRKWGAIYLCSDPSIQRGDVRIESSVVVINCALERELANLRAHLLKGEEG